MCEDLNTTLRYGFFSFRNLTHDHRVTLFFKEWTTRSLKEYIGACVAIALLAFVYEGLKASKHLVSVRQRKCHKSSIIILTMHKVKYRHSTFRVKKIAYHLLQTFVHLCEIFCGLLLMIAFMLFDGYLCISIMAGYMLGYLMFGWIPVATTDRDCYY